MISHLRNKHKRYRDITANQDGDGNYEVTMIVECAFTWYGEEDDECCHRNNENIVNSHSYNIKQKIIQVIVEWTGFIIVLSKSTSLRLLTSRTILGVRPLLRLYHLYILKEVGLLDSRSRYLSALIRQRQIRQITGAKRKPSGARLVSC